jgi:hypothetical protein
MRDREHALESLHPSNDFQKQALAKANSAVDAIGQARLQMSFALSSPVSYPLVLIVVGWGMFLFCGFGLMSKGHMRCRWSRWSSAPSRFRRRFT